MRTVRTALMAGATALGLGCLATAAQAQAPTGHLLVINLPGGGQARVAYTGDTLPPILLMPPMVMADLPTPFGPSSPFAAMDRMMARMDREAAAMLQQAERMAATPLPAFHAMPRGGESYTYVATFSGNGACERSVTITQASDGAAPHVVSHVTGRCGRTALPRATQPVGQPALPHRPGTILVDGSTTGVVPARHAWDG